MNIEKLRLAEDRFLMQYPGGFSNPEMLEIAKKHKIEKMIEMTKRSLSSDSFKDPIAAVEAIQKIVAGASMVSIFEKTRFRDIVRDMSDDEKIKLSGSMDELLHGDQEKGFNKMLDILQKYKMAKWTILTVCLLYSNPSEEVFIKPTTTKGVIKYFELEGVEYKPQPSYEFYREYRRQINEMKKEMDESLRVDNASFCGFFIMAMEL
ncbi:MAG: hypothetical protein JJE29_05210 [Peptostreptococcaceae bacterium]|nr:hypothetical protein [Peptostreptococcaceae bacterium]